MRGEGWLEPADVRFGVALPDERGARGAWNAWDAVGAFAASAGPAGTLELPLESFLSRAGDAAALAAALPAGVDLCLRLGPDFIGPALMGGRAAFGGAGTSGAARATEASLAFAAAGASGAAEGAGSVEAAYLRAVAACRRAADDPALGGRVVAYLLEFPNSIPYGPAARRHLDRALRDLAGLSLTVAFYGADWYSVRVVEGLKERGAALCLLDLPRGPTGLPAIDVATAPLVYVKRWGGDSLEAWVPRLEALAIRAERLRVLVAARGASPGDVLAAARQAAAMRTAWVLRAGAGAEPRCAGDGASDLTLRAAVAPEEGF
ncbi:DUF72 domain-containing protein [bacterium]|nr:DUF72 domain-containing protein [bacterium]